MWDEMSKRTPKDEMTAWLRRIVELREKEERCPGCIKVRKVDPHDICRDHKTFRYNMLGRNERR